MVDAGASSNVPITRIVSAGIARYVGSRRREDIESAMEEGVMEALPRLEKRTQYLATLANVATLLGLLGTIIGLDPEFVVLANSQIICQSHDFATSSCSSRWSVDTRIISIRTLGACTWRSWSS